MNKSIILVALFMLVLVVFSCKDDNTSQVKEDILTSKAWVIQSKIINPAYSLVGFTISDASTLDSPEVKEYTYKHATDGTLTQSSGSNSIVFQTKWAFSADEKKLQYTPGIIFSYPVVGDISLTTMDIVSIAEDKMVMKVPYTFELIKYEVTITFVPK